MMKLNIKIGKKSRKKCNDMLLIFLCSTRAGTGLPLYIIYYARISLR